MKVRTAVFAVALLANTAVADYTAEQSWTFQLDPGGRISLENINGDVEVNGIAGNTVEVLAVKKAGSEAYLEKMEIIIDARADSIRIETRHPNSGIKGMFNWGNDSSGSVRYTLSVPTSAVLDEIESVNGNVNIAGVDGRVKASTVNGEVNAHDLLADATLETVNGSVEARFDRLQDNQKVSCESVNGRVSVFLPGDADVSVSAETINGGIDGEAFGLKVDKGFVGRELEGDIGQGSARLNLSTVNGSIKIRKN